MKVTKKMVQMASLTVLFLLMTAVAALAETPAPSPSCPNPQVLTLASTSPAPAAALPEWLSAGPLPTLNAANCQTICCTSNDDCTQICGTTASCSRGPLSCRRCTAL